MQSASTFDIAKALASSCIREFIAYIFSNKTTRITTQSITSYPSFNRIHSITSFCVNFIGVSFAPQYSLLTVQDSIFFSCIYRSKSSGQPKLPNSVLISIVLTLSTSTSDYSFNLCEPFRVDEV